jgi:pyruvate dehydrogenase complex dehydrogenase (E1) component
MNDDLRGDAAEIGEWLDALDSVEAFEGLNRVDELLDAVVTSARRKGAQLPFAANTAYVNTIRPGDQPPHPGDRRLEQTIRRYIRWNAAAIVLRANKESSELGGHIASFQSAATSSISRATVRPAFTRAPFLRGASAKTSSSISARKSAVTACRPIRTRG